MLRKSLVTAVIASMLVMPALGPALAAKPVKNLPPTVTAFDVPATSPSPVPITVFNADDSDGTVTGYLVTESSTPPDASSPNWSASQPADYTTSSTGSVTLYAWAKDDANDVSDPASDVVNIPDPGDARIAALEAAVADLQARLAAVEANSALQLDGYVEVNHNTIDGLAGPHVIFGGTTDYGVNVHVQNGNPDRATHFANGLGNLIIGYNESPPDMVAGDRGGSHNLVLGRNHKYLSNDSIVHGWGATVTEHASAAIAADGTTIDRSYSASVAGRDNHIINRGVIVGATNSTLQGFESVIVGGSGNTTGDASQMIGEGSVVVGGENNRARGFFATATGGEHNMADGDYSNVTGGDNNNAGGIHSAAFGGAEHTSIGFNSVVVGGLANQAAGDYSTISGGGLSIVLLDYLGWCGGGNCTPVP